MNLLNVGVHALSWYWPSTVRTWNWTFTGVATRGSSLLSSFKRWFVQLVSFRCWRSKDRIQIKIPRCCHVTRGIPPISKPTRRLVPHRKRRQLPGIPVRWFSRKRLFLALGLLFLWRFMSSFASFHVHVHSITSIFSAADVAVYTVWCFWLRSVS